MKRRKAKRFTWTEQETALMHNKELSIDDLCQLMPHRTRTSINNKRARITKEKGLTKTRKASARWTNDECQVLISNAHKTSKEIQKRFFPYRSVYAINFMRHKLTGRPQRIKTTEAMAQWIIENRALIASKGVRWGHQQFNKAFNVTASYNSFKRRRETIMRKFLQDEAIVKRRRATLPAPVAACRKALLDKKLTPSECAEKWGQIVADAALKSLRPQANILKDIETPAQRRFIIDNKHLPDNQIAFFLETSARQVAVFRKFRKSKNL